MKSRRTRQKRGQAYERNESLPVPFFVSTAQMRKLDQAAIEKFGIPGLILMENAGRGIAELARGMVKRLSFPRRRESKYYGSPLTACGDDNNLCRNAKIVVICGQGNNGGDGFVAARHLFNFGFGVQVILIGTEKGLKEDLAVNYKILRKMRMPIVMLDPDCRGGFQTRTYKQSEALIRKSDLIIDAIFGIGLTRPVEGIFYEMISLINHSKKPVLAVDIPSGLDSDTGKALGVAVKADVTGTLAFAKQGLKLHDGPSYAGNVKVLDISIPRL